MSLIPLNNRVTRIAKKRLDTLDTIDVLGTLDFLASLGILAFRL